jgi:uncharacterized protein YaiE (UPF0345 family)
MEDTMDKFENISVIKKANIYFDGKVSSRTVLFDNGEKKTLGIMLPGEYKFGTEKKEIMEVLSGNLEIKFQNNDRWCKFSEGDVFEVEPNSSFQLIVKEATDYCCSYIEV